MQHDWNAIYDVIMLFVPDRKIALAVLNKFKVKAGEEPGPEFGAVGEYHWDLAKVKLSNDNFIGWYDGVRRYYSGIVEFDLYNLELSVSSKWEPMLRGKIMAANKILQNCKSRGGTDA